MRNGGIASTYYHLARTLAGDGHSVTVLYFKGMQCENETIEHWIEFYRHLAIRFVPLPAVPTELICSSPRWQRQMYEFHDWLKGEPPYDVVHASEWRGGIYYALLARRLALAFERTLFVVKTSSPWIWNRHYRMLPLSDRTELARMYAERRVVECADIVIGGSAHLLTFMAHKGYRLPAHRTFVQPNIIDLQDLNVEEKRPRYRYGDRVETSELVFFGRLEARKGLDIFCDAVARIIETGVRPCKITFLGKQGERLPAYPRMTSIEFIRQQARAWPFPVEIIDSYDQDRAIGYLCGSPRIAVMPSVIENSTMTVYECLVHRIPFLATAVGGTPELIAERYHDRVLVAPHPEPLAAALQEVLRTGGTVAEGAFDYEENLAVWRDFHRDLAGALAKKAPAAVVADIGHRHQLEASAGLPAAGTNAAGGRAPPRTPEADSPRTEARISACIYHHRRPEFLEALLESLLLQERKVDEVVIVCDGGRQEEALEALAPLEERLGPSACKLFEQPHRCIGSALNAAARQSSGDLIVFLNAERHYCEPHLVDVFRRATAESPAAAFTCFHGFIKGRSPCPSDSGDTRRALPLGGDLATGFYEDGAFGGSCFAVRRAAFLELGGFYEGYHLGGIEQEFHARLVLAGHDLEVVPETLYRERPTGCGTPFDMRSKEYLAIRPFLSSAPGYLENLMLAARMLARKTERSEAEIHYHQGEAIVRRGDWDAARVHWEHMRRAFPDHAAGFVRGAEALRGAGRWEEAEALAGQAVERFPDRPNAHFQWAEAAMRRGDWNAACGRWEQLRRAFPDHKAGFVRGAEALRGAERWEEAEALAGQAVERFPDRPNAHFQWAEAAMRRGDWNAACGRWEQLRRAFPDHKAGFVRGAEALRGAERWEEAEALAGQAVERFPDHRGIRVQWAEAAMRRGDWSVACGRWEQLRRAFPDHAAGFVRGAEALRSAGRWEEAEALAGQAVERFPDHHGAHAQWSRIATRPRKRETSSGRRPKIGQAILEGAAGLVRAQVAAEGTLIDVFDVDTGRPLRGSSMRVREGGWSRSEKRRTRLRPGSRPWRLGGIIRRGE